MEPDDVEKQIKELIPQSEIVLCWDAEGEILIGFAKKLGEWKRLELLQKDDPQSDHNPFNGKKILEGHTSISLLKVSSSPGHYAIVCGKRVWVPYP